MTAVGLPEQSTFLFLSYLVTISFPIQFEVWGRLCTHFETAKVMTFHLSLNISQCQLSCVTQNQNIFFFRKGQTGRIVKERIQISYSTHGAGVGRNDTWKHH